ncbi:MAG: tRNA (cytidine(34)-2'-O)-methyltransferase [Deltaproteobacteria bacterium]|nr:tRNA (cytidine(34)-2'-O)-methyltransferase [Deltaproteobacteria bacterium]
MHVVLVTPQIPQNTGSISRLCAATGTHLHLVGELGFSLADRYLKRAGLDYWPHVLLHRHETLDECLASADPASVAFYSSHATSLYTDFAPPADPWMVFGREADGLPKELLARESARTYSIPILPVVRSLNLANAVSIVLYEALRQRGFPLGG